jgi:hypothetical protein
MRAIQTPAQQQSSPASRVLQMAVDITRRHDLSIHLDISFPSVPCAGE